MLEWLGSSPTEGLTPKQETLLEDWRDAYLALGLSTEPADREAAEAARALAYHMAGMKAPQAFVWVDNPYDGSLGAAFLDMIGASQPFRVGTPAWNHVCEGTRKQVSDQVWDAPDSMAWEQIGEGFWDPVETQLRPVLDQIRNQVRDQATDELGAVPPETLAEEWELLLDVEDTPPDPQPIRNLDQLRDWVRADVKTRFNKRIRSQTFEAGFGQYDAHWVGAFAFANQHLGLSEKIAGLDGLA